MIEARMTIDEAWQKIRDAKDAAADDATWHACTLIEVFCRNLKNPRFCNCGTIIARPERLCQSCKERKEATQAFKLQRQLSRVDPLLKAKLGTMSRTEFIMRGIESGKTLAEIAKELGISRQRVYALSYQRKFKTKRGSELIQEEPKKPS